MRRCAIIVLFLLASTPTHASLNITEIFPAPESGNYEWVELYNSESIPVDLREFSLTDLASRSIMLPHLLLEGKTYVLATSSGILNNNGDTLFLRHSVHGNTAIATYSGTLGRGQSFIACEDRWEIVDIVTPGFENASCQEGPDINIEPSLSIGYDAQTSPIPAESVISPPLSSTKQSFKPTMASPRPSLQSFTEKHAPVIVTLSPSPSPSLILPLQLATEEPPSQRQLPRSHPFFIPIFAVICAPLGIVAAYSAAQYIRRRYTEKEYDPLSIQDT